jgi:hypothetical protein
MAAFFYFLPRAKRELIFSGRLQHGRLPAGLASVLQDVHDCPAQVVTVETSAGPDGQAGTVLYPVPTHGELPGNLGYFQEAQTWRACPDDTPDYWIGWLTDAPPLPADLERSQLVSGWYCTDPCGQRWIAPIVRSPRNPRGNLPYEVTFERVNRQLKPVCSVAGRHRPLWDDTGTLWDWALNRGQPNQEGLLILGEGFTADEDVFLIDCACRGLGVNYRLDLEGIGVLAVLQPGWLGKNFVSLIVNALIDYRAKLLWDEAQKKTGIRSDPGGVSSTPGAPAAGPTTAQAAAN